MMERVAIIPARGSSKRLRRKNILPVLGRPMLSYPIKSSLESGLFEEVIVSTEDQEIAQKASESGARVVRRPNDLAIDSSTVVEVCMHVLDALEEEDKRPKHFCCIYATAIFVLPQDLSLSYSLLTEEPESDFVMGVSEYNLHPVKALMEKDHFLKPMWPEYQGIKSQFYPRLLCSNGTLYWAEATAFRKTKSFYGERLKGYVVPQMRAVDIDTEEDYEIAKLFAARLLKGKEGK